MELELKLGPEPSAVADVVEAVVVVPEAVVEVAVWKNFALAAAIVVVAVVLVAEEWQRSEVPAEGHNLVEERLFCHLTRFANERVCVAVFVPLRALPTSKDLRKRLMLPVPLFVLESGWDERSSRQPDLPARTELWPGEGWTVHVP